MARQKIPLASDNCSPAHPLILKAVIEANEGYASAYGADFWTEEAEKAIQKTFKSECKVFIVPTGTGSNIFGLRLSCQRHESVLCSDTAHLAHQEAGAAESLVGCKLLLVPSKEGKITPQAVLEELERETAIGKHSTLPRVLSLTQSTEVGTVYTLKELRALSKLCKEKNLFLHIDGARLYNAAAYLKVSLHEIAEAASIDILSLGGTKNGLLGAEALLIFNPSLEAASDHLHKQTLQLTSKMRYLSAQYPPLLKDDLWLTLAKQANQKAQEIASIIKSTPGLSLNYPVETNQLFFTAPADWISLIQEKVFCYPWDISKNELRFVTSWNTSDEEIAKLRSIFSEVN